MSRRTIRGTVGGLLHYRNVNDAFVGLLTDVIVDGALVTVRGATTRELTHRHVTLDAPLERSIAVAYRHNDPFAAIAETAWVLAGRNDIAFLTPYLPRAHQFADDGATWRAGYGARIRRWGDIDQLARVVELLRTDPETRRAVISIYDPATDVDGGRDVPCTNWLQFIIRDGVLDVAVTVRSNDLFWGFSGINTFEWSVLLEAVAHWVGAAPGKAHYFIGSLHLYERHFHRAARILEQSTATRPVEGPRSAITTAFEDFDEMLSSWFGLEAAIRSGVNVADEVNAFPDPLFRDFLRMLQFRWAPSTAGDVIDADLRRGRESFQAWQTGTEATATEPSTFDDLRPAVAALHRAKDAIYGPSWKKRGERIGVLANIARKIDRLEQSNLQADDPTENVLDTAVDLYIYALKYQTFLLDQMGAPAMPGKNHAWSEGPDGLEQLLSEEPAYVTAHHAGGNATFDAFRDVEAAVEAGGSDQKWHAAATLTRRAQEMLMLVVSYQPRRVAEFLRDWVPIPS